MTTPIKTFWFYFKPYVYPVVKNHNVLLLNTLDMNAVIFNDEPEFTRLVERMLEPEAFGVVEITSDSDKYTQYSIFIDKVCDHKMGTLEEAGPGIEKPVVLTPYHLRMHSVTKGEIRKPGSNITLVIDNECTKNCTLCEAYFKQFKCCSKYGDIAFMDVQMVRDIVQDVSADGPFVINVCGGDIAMHPALGEIVEVLSASAVKSNYHIYYKNCTGGFQSIVPPENTVIIADFPICETKHLEPLERYTFNFILTNKEDLQSCRDFVTGHNIHQFYVSAVDTGMHGDFLKENFFLLQDGLVCEAGRLPFSDRIRIINNHYFYRTFILPDGDVCGSSYGNTVGNMYRNPLTFIRDAINGFHDEIWNKSRDNTICFNCLFNYICPLLSRYDFPEPRFTIKIDDHVS
ncbi:MAG: hypothetical protein WCR43_03435 [Bacteroidales bacterium]